MPYDGGFHWIAHYNDGSNLDQRNGATYADIDRTRMEAFSLYDGERPLVMVDFRDKIENDPEVGPRRLIWRKRSLMRSDGVRVSVHLVGWQRTVAGRNVQAICYINGDGTIIMGDQWMESRPLVHPVELAPFET